MADNRLRVSLTYSLKKFYYRESKIKISIIFVLQFQQLLYNLFSTIKYGIIFKFKIYNQIINDENEYIWKEEREESKKNFKNVSL